MMFCFNNRSPAAWMVLIAMAVVSEMPLISFRSLRGAFKTPFKLPKRLIKFLAMGFTSLRGIAMNNKSSSNS